MFNQRGEKGSGSSVNDDSQKVNDFMSTLTPPIPIQYVRHLTCN